MKLRAKKKPQSFIDSGCKIQMNNEKNSIMKTMNINQTQGIRIVNVVSTSLELHVKEP